MVEEEEGEKLRMVAAFVRSRKVSLGKLSELEQVVLEEDLVEMRRKQG